MPVRLTARSTFARWAVTIGIALSYSLGSVVTDPGDQGEARASRPAPRSELGNHRAFGGCRRPDQRQRVPRRTLGLTLAPAVDRGYRLVGHGSGTRGERRARSSTENCPWHGLGPLWSDRSAHVPLVGVVEVSDLLIRSSTESGHRSHTGRQRTMRVGVGHCRLLALLYVAAVLLARAGGPQWMNARSRSWRP
jgi:hypothetical protein